MKPEVLPPLETTPPAGSVLGAARASRRLSVEEAAARAGLDPETVRSLEEARVYRFATTQDALAAALLYATSLELSEREARQLAGLPVPSRAAAALLSVRVAAGLLLAGAFAGLAWFAIVPRLGDEPSARPAATATAPPAPAAASETLPQPWQITVVVYNGTNRPGAAVQMANRVAGLAYRIGDVGDAPRTDYPETRVYFPPGGEAIAKRLGAQLGVGTAALPGGDDPRRLVVIVGREP